MCGRYYISTDDQSDLMTNILAELKRRWPDSPVQTGEIAPSQLAPALYSRQSEGKDQTAAGPFRWGFPGFSGSQLVINARSETAVQKPMFAQTWQSGRILLPASAFFEWKKAKNKARAEKICFFLPDQAGFFMAGLARLYPEKAHGAQNLPRFVILTSPANCSVQPVHDRMPLLIEQAALKDWLFDDKAALQLLAEPVRMQLQARPTES